MMKQSSPGIEDPEFKNTMKMMRMEMTLLLIKKESAEKEQNQSNKEPLGGIEGGGGEHLRSRAMREKMASV